ncbi:MAG: imidazolonepropionase [Aestuariivirga sp.]
MTRRLFSNVSLATLCEGAQPYGLIQHGALAISNGQIEWVGAKEDLPKAYRNWAAVDCGGRLMTPGLIDCHTHIVFGGNRASEFELRLQGASYEEIARAGGGIISTVKATREATEAELLDQALPRVDALMAEGVSVIEIKSGYGLDRETELRMLRVARQIATRRPVFIKTSFLGAHAIPPEFKGRSSDYINDVCIPALRAAHAEGLVDAVDGFCEGIAFSISEIDRVFKVAKDLGLPVKLHAEQLSNLGGAILAASYGALSADHLEYLDEAGVMAMAKSGTNAVILPGAFYMLREKQLPPIALLRKHKVPMAVSTDCNPGSSPITSLLLTMNMAATLFRMTPEECLRGVTINAARAMGLKNCGTLEPGKRADLALWNVAHPNELTYRIGFNPLHTKYFAGKRCEP